MRWSLSFTLVVVATLAGCLDASPSGPPVTPDVAPSWPELLSPLAQPITMGNLTWRTTDYDLGNTTVGGPAADHDGYEYESLIRGTFTVPDGVGPFPLAVFLHGQHQTGTDAAPYRNDKGYVYLMEYLASHGIATASILAHEINRRNGQPDVGMWARGELALATIDAFNASEFAPRLDFNHLGLMGHSRGGEGVVTAAEVNLGRAVPHNLTSIIALAPTDFAYRSVPSIPFLTLAPYCDGDVYNLHGLRQFDQSRYTDNDVVKVQLLVMGANHNNYNTMWGGDWTTPVTSTGDDASFGSHQNTHCDLRREDGGGRLSLDETYAESTLHLGGFLRWTLLGDEALAPYFLGAQQPAEACPGKVACPGAVHISTMTPGRRDLFWVDQTGPVGAPGVTVPPAKACRMEDCAANVYSSAWMADLSALTPTDPQGWTDFILAMDEPMDGRETPVLNVRVAVTTDGNVNAFGPPQMRITFASGDTIANVMVDDSDLFLPPSMIFEPPGGVPFFGSIGGSKVSANTIEVPIPPAIDLGNLTAITLSFRGTGPERVLLADAWMNRATGAARTPDGLGPTSI